MLVKYGANDAAQGNSVTPLAQRLMTFIDTYYPESKQLYVTSAKRQEPGSYHHGNLFWNGSQCVAVDFGAYDDIESNDKDQRDMRDFSKWIEDHFWYLLAELIHTTPYADDDGWYVSQGQRIGSFGGATDSAHINHVHVAVSEASMSQMEQKAKDWGWKPVNGSNGGAVTPPTTTQEYTFGWDASDFDWDRGLTDQRVQQAAIDGIYFFTHKITEGTTTTHKNAGRFLKNAKAKGGGKATGFYVVTRTPGNGGNGSIADQVAYAIAAADKQHWEWHTDPKFFWQVDLEHWGYDDVAPIHAIAMANALSLTGKKVVIYAPKWAYENTIPANPYPLWSSNYSNSGAPRPFRQQWADSVASGAGFQPYSGKTPLIWQYSSDAVISGQPTTDANSFKGSTADFDRVILGISSTTPPPVVVPPVPPVEDPTITALKAQLAAAEAARVVAEGAARVAEAKVASAKAKLKEALDSLG